jgi:hypothetical protein
MARIEKQRARLGDPTLITEKAFVLAHTSFWQELLPASERFVRAMNLCVERFEKPLRPRSPEALRGLVNELAMRLVAAAFDESVGSEQLLASHVTLCVQAATAFIRRFRQSSREELPPLTPEGIEESKELAQRLEGFFHTHANEALELFPLLPGFGWLDECNCDAWTAEAIFEIKSGDRTFRSIDVRQVLAYLALNHLAGGRHLGVVFLVNPRRGIFFRIEVEELASELSARPFVELVQEIQIYLLEPIVHLPSR